MTEPSNLLRADPDKHLALAAAGSCAEIVSRVVIDGDSPSATGKALGYPKGSEEFLLRIGMERLDRYYRKDR